MNGATSYSFTWTLMYVSALTVPEYGLCPDIGLAVVTTSPYVSSIEPDLIVDITYFGLHLLLIYPFRFHIENS